jgi:hypothetical protein
MKNQFCNDVDGNILELGDMVVVLDAEDLEGDAPKRGQRLLVVNLNDAESNYVEFVGDLKQRYGFYAHRVLKLTW